jgi:hypothetical protein
MTIPLLRTAAIFLLVLSGGACAYLPRSRPIGIDAAAVRELGAVQTVLESADRASAHLLLTEIGRAVYPGMDAPIWRVAYRPFQADLKQVLVLAGTRGNETAGLEFALTLIERLRSAPGSDTLYDLDIIPMVNPWGWIHDRPFTQEGIDIVDDFNRFDSREARTIRRFLRDKRYDLVLDLSEDPRATGFYLRQYAIGRMEASARIIDRLRAAGYPIESDPGRILLKPQNGIVEMPGWILAVMRSTRQLTMAGYIRRNVSNRVFSVVTPANFPMPERVAMQRMAAEGLLAELAGPADPAERTPD